MIVPEIAEYVKEHGITQSFLSDKTGLHPKCISNSLMCRRKMRIDEYMKICDALEVSYDYFYELHKKKRA